MEDNIEVPPKKDEIELTENNNLDYKLFFNHHDQKDRKEIFDIIYNSLFKENEKIDIEDSPERIEDDSITKDDKYINKTNEEIITLFNKKEKEINNDLEKYKIKLGIYEDYTLYLENFQKNYCIPITCLRNVKFEEEYEWICNPSYLLYFQYIILNYEKPSSIQSIDEKGENKEKVITIDSISKANILLNDENFIYIKDTGVQNIDYNKIFEDGSKEFDLSKKNIMEYLDYNENDPKQIIDADKIYNNNYTNIIEYAFDSHFSNLIYSFQNGYYFFEYNLVGCLELFQKRKKKFLYLNIKKIKKILNIKYSFKKYLIFWLSKLFVEDKQKQISNSEVNKNDEIMNKKEKFIYFIKKLIDSIVKNKSKYLEIILDVINNKLSKTDNINGQNRNDIICNELLVILNNIDYSDIEWIEKKKYVNLNILFIFNIQYNFDIFQSYYYEESILKKYFLENNDEIIYKDPTKENINNYFYNIFESKDKYEMSKKDLITTIIQEFKDNNDKLLNIAFILNIYQIIKKITDEKKSVARLKTNLGIASDIIILKPFLPLINFIVSVNEDNIIFNIDNIKFKEMYFYEFLKKIYKSTMIKYLNTNSNQFYLDDIKGPLLEKDIILNILTGQIDNSKYGKYSYFKEIKVQSIYCLNYDEKKNYEDNKNNNIVITQENKTAEFYDVAFKINKNNKNYMKFCQISILKDDNDLKKLNKKSIILDIINFDLKKEKLNIGNIDGYSFVIITSMNVFNEYKKLDEEKRQNHTFFKMKEHCEKNNFEFYIYDYFENNMYIYDINKNNIEISDDFFEEIKKLDLFDKNLGLYNFIGASEKKLSLKYIRNDLFYPIENYYQAEIENKIHIINLAKFKFERSMLKMSTNIKDIGLAFWNYNNKHFDNLMINLNEKKEYFKGNKIIENKSEIFENPNNKKLHALLFSLETEENNKIDEKKKIFLQRKRKNKELYSGNFSELVENASEKRIK